MLGSIRQECGVHFCLYPKCWEGKVRKISKLGDEGAWGSLMYTELFELGKDLLPELLEAAAQQL